MGCSYPGSANHVGLATAGRAREQAPATEKPAGVDRGPTDAELKSDDSPVDRKMVYSASLGVVVLDIEKAVAATETIAGEFGGYVAQVRTNQITIRVPAADYRLAMDRVSQLGTVTHRTVDAQDVTEKYVDLEARLKNARAVRARLEALLQKAEDAKAAVEIERELFRIGEQIEQMQAKLELLRNRVAYSMISATFQRVAPQADVPAARELPFRWLRELRPEYLLSEGY
ncbi:MAG: DUF4349 domain-containing protein [Phycisphaerales bacterium]|nr:DUF4349 domain-containing protein [Phycisphaerales bacterium]